MAEELPILHPAEDPRICPECGTRVATLASTCLMCGYDLEGDEAAVAHTPEPEPKKRLLPRLARAAAIVGLALVILAAGGLGLLAALNNAERAAPTVGAPPTPTRRATPTITSTPTAVFSPTPTVPPTAIPPRSHQVRQGETLSEIATEYEVSVTEILQFNADLDPELLQVGQVLLIPPDLSQLGASADAASGDPNATRADFVVHVVRSGEALLSIAEKYGVTVQAIRRANDIGAYEDALKVNQSLIIPLAEPSPTPTTTPDPNATPTPRPPYPAPSLLSPIDGELVDGTARLLVLQWASVGVLAENEWYEVKLELAGGGDFSASHVTRTTAWRVPTPLLASAGAGERVFRWQVHVVKERQVGEEDGAYAWAGSPSAVRAFTWIGPDLTPTLNPP